MACPRPRQAQSWLTDLRAMLQCRIWIPETVTSPAAKSYLTVSLYNSSSPALHHAQPGGAGNFPAPDSLRPREPITIVPGNDNNLITVWTRDMKSPSLTASAFRKSFPQLVKHTGANDVEALLACLKLATLEPGETLVEDGTRISSLFLVWDGELCCRIENGDQQVEIGRIGPGQYVGEVSLLDPGPATATVIAESPTTVYELSREDFDRLGQANPVIRSKLIRAMVAQLIERLRSSDQLLFQLFDSEEPQEAVTAPSSRSESGQWYSRVYHRLLGSEGNRS